MIVRRLISALVLLALFGATGPGPICELNCNALSSNRLASAVGMTNHHQMHHDMANCRDCVSHKTRSSMNEESCHHVDQAPAVQKARSTLAASNLRSHAGLPYDLSSLAPMHFAGAERRLNSSLSPERSKAKPSVSLRV
jgi:hypothetical protein